MVVLPEPPLGFRTTMRFMVTLLSGTDLIRFKRTQARMGAQGERVGACDDCEFAHANCHTRSVLFPNGISTPLVGRPGRSHPRMSPPRDLGSRRSGCRLGTARHWPVGRGCLAPAASPSLRPAAA